jgi:hypothetical protein
MLRKAYSLRPAGSRTPRRSAVAEQTDRSPDRIDVVFGADGNSSALTGYGWSVPEDGFTWAIDDRSLLTLPLPGTADMYRLEMDIIPYVAPPVLLAQTMRVVINGELVHTFDPLPRGTVACEIPGHKLSRHDTIELVLDHPTAASPSAVAGENDGRRLGVAFYRLSLSRA